MWSDWHYRTCPGKCQAIDLILCSNDYNTALVTVVLIADLSVLDPTLAPHVHSVSYLYSLLYVTLHMTLRVTLYVTLRATLRATLHVTLSVTYQDSLYTCITLNM